MKNRIILPLDNMDIDIAFKIMRETKGMVWGYKVRKIIIDEGISVIRDLKQYGNIMVDFKLYDIPSAITESLQTHFRDGADISTIHCSSDYIPDDNVSNLRIAGVTILTSMTGESFNKYYRGPEILHTVIEMAKNAAEHDYGYLVCSPLELEFLNNIKIIKICPGIRPVWYDKSDDQDRVSTPSYAIKNGAGLLVIGRPILSALDRQKAIVQTNNEINETLQKG